MVVVREQSLNREMNAELFPFICYPVSALSNSLVPFMPLFRGILTRIISALAFGLLTILYILHSRAMERKERTVPSPITTETQLQR